MIEPTHAQAEAKIHKRIKALAVRARSWMLDQSFAFWAERGPSPNGGFYERLDLSGRGIAGEPSRVRVQARHGFCFALAADLGWNRTAARTLCERSVAVLTRDCRRPDGLYGRRVVPGQGMTDDGAELYDSAFALLAFATIWRVFALDAARDAGAALSAAIDDHLKRPDEEGGYRERLPAPERREQNPHMHLCEASLAWFEASGDAAALARAQGLAAFVRARFYDADRHALLEYARENADNHCESGHFYEWVWILATLDRLEGVRLEGVRLEGDRLEGDRLGGGAAAHDFADALYADALTFAAPHDYFALSQHVDGAIREPMQRTWGLTEALKAHIAVARRDRSLPLLHAIADTADRLFADHVDGALPGAWIDVRGPDGGALAADITPATGYHIYLAFAELIEFSDALDA